MKKEILAIIFFLALAAKAQPPEVKLLRSIYNDSSFVKTDLAKGISASVLPISLIVPGAMLIKGWYHRDTMLIDQGFKACVAFGVNTALTLGIKYITERNRPFVIYPNYFHPPRAVETGYSFPSGHTSFAFATATSLCMVFPKWYFIIPAYAWALSTGWSRMYLGVHYPTDVLMGAITGSLSSFLSFKLEKWLSKKGKPNTKLTSIQ